jgi:prolyl-tRNA editing enzyme YbaK/EbsC (Cys-tRNA(Pro) deacylase)
MSFHALNSIDLQKFIDENQIEATILSLKEHTPTVVDAARVLEVETNQIIKSLVFITPDESLLVINNGLNRVDQKKIAAHLGMGKARVKFASPDQALAVTGYVVGSMPPFGHIKKLPTLVDPAVIDQKVVFGGGGEINAMMRIDSAELARVTGAEVMALSE